MNRTEYTASKLLRGVSAVAIFLLCIISFFLVIVSATFGSRSFYTENIDNENTKQAVLNILEEYLNEISNQTTIPLEVFLQGYDEDDISNLLTLHTQDTVELLFNGVKYPEMRAYEICDFAAPLNNFAGEYLNNGEYSVSDSDLLYEEINSIAWNNLVYVNNITRVVNLASLQDGELLSTIGPLLQNSAIFAVNAVLLTVLIAFLSWMRLYKDCIWRGGYVTFGTLSLASAVAYSVALAFSSLKVGSRIPIEAGTPLHTALINLLGDFESTATTISAACFYVLLAALVVAIWLYTKPKQEISAPEEEEYRW